MQCEHLPYLLDLLDFSNASSCFFLSDDTKEVVHQLGFLGAWSITSIECPQYGHSTVPLYTLEAARTKGKSSDPKIIKGPISKPINGIIDMNRPRKNNPAPPTHPKENFSKVDAFVMLRGLRARRGSSIAIE